MYDPASSTGETFSKASYSYLDGTVGMSFNARLGENEDNNFYIGLAYHHLNKSKKISFYSDSKAELAPKWVASGGSRMNTDEYSFVTFEGDYSMQSSAKETTGGLLYTRKLDDPAEPKYLIHAGAYIRLNDAIIPVFKVESRPLAVAVSYDVNISGLKQVSSGRGGFEISLTYQKFVDKNNSNKNLTKCPKF